MVMVVVLRDADQCVGALVGLSACDTRALAVSPRGDGGLPVGTRLPYR